jgi:plastocyanin
MTNNIIKAVKNGFRWSNPSRNGMLCHTFDKCGVYYFGDISGDESSSYIGIVAVKKKMGHFIMDYMEDKKRFEQELITTMESGDLVWWKWNKSQTITMNLVDAQLIGDKKIEREKCKGSVAQSQCDDISSNILARSGIYSFKIKYAGCYYFAVSNGSEQFTVTIIATSAEKDHKIAISDVDAKPPILNIHPDDRVWFVWDEAKKPQNIRQVNHHNQVVNNGFISGALMDSPATFVQKFESLGIYYYRSDNTKGLLGAVVVLHEPTIQVVHVDKAGIVPDPIVVHTNDLVIWEFTEFQSYDLVRVKTEKDLFEYADSAKQIVPRRYLSRAFKEIGVYHFVSPSFDTTVDPKNIENARGIDVFRILLT